MKEKILMRVAIVVAMGLIVGAFFVGHFVPAKTVPALTELGPGTMGFVQAAVNPAAMHPELAARFAAQCEELKMHPITAFRNGMYLFVCIADHRA